METAWTLRQKKSIYRDESQHQIDTYQQSHEDIRLLRDSELAEAEISLRELTLRLMEPVNSYSPRLWCSRSKLLLQLGFPELAIGDAFNARQLVNWSKRVLRLTQPSDSPSKAFLSESEELALSNLFDEAKSSALLLAQGLLLANSFHECMWYIDTYTAGLSNAADFQNLRKVARAAFRTEERLQQQNRTTEAEPTWDRDDSHLDLENLTHETEWRKVQAELDQKWALRSGEIFATAYPWLSRGLLSRSAATIEKVNGELVAPVTSTAGEEILCQVNESSVRNSIRFRGLMDRHTDVLGIFAKRRISKGRQVFFDETPLCAVDDPRNRCSNCCDVLPGQPFECSCCGSLFCSENGCARKAKYTYHKAIQGKDVSDFTKFRTRDERPAKVIADERLLLRVLSSAVQDRNTHPLKSRLINRMTAHYSRDEPRRFSLFDDIIQPKKMLAALGIDIFRNHDYDTWVLMTIQARICTNVRDIVEDNHYFVALNLCYIFFNHSCEPNVSAEVPHGAPQSALVMTATRDVRAGEELFISYLDDNLELPLNERRKILKDWMGGACQCTRCCREENGVVKKRKLEVPEELSGEELEERSPNKRFHRFQRPL